MYPAYAYEVLVVVIQLEAKNNLKGSWQRSFLLKTSSKPNIFPLAKSCSPKGTRTGIRTETQDAVH